MIFFSAFEFFSYRSDPHTLWIRRGVQSLIHLLRSDASHYFHVGIHRVPDRISVISHTEVSSHPDPSLSHPDSPALSTLKLYMKLNKLRLSSIAVINNE